MQQLTEEGRRVVDDVAQRHGFSSEAVTRMLSAVAAGNGTQAQFNDMEFGGMGQWSSGGMLMIGDMFNDQLKGRVGALCQELSGLIQAQPLFAPPAQSQTQSQGGGWQGQGNGGQAQMQGSGQQQSQGGITGSSLFVAGTGTNDWWPADLGAAGSVGAQNNLRYAYFPSANRLAIDVNGQVTVYDTGGHQIGGFSQQQGGDQSLLFTSQFGLVRVADLPIVPGPGAAIGGGVQTSSAGFGSNTEQVQTKNGEQAGAGVASSVMPAVGTRPVPTEEIFSLIEKLADLHAKGILTDSEFETKKAELLSRL